MRETRSSPEPPPFRAWAKPQPRSRHRGSGRSRAAAAAAAAASYQRRAHLLPPLAAAVEQSPGLFFSPFSGDGDGEHKSHRMHVASGSDACFVGTYVHVHVHHRRSSSDVLVLTPESDTAHIACMQRRWIDLWRGRSGSSLVCWRYLSFCPYIPAAYQSVVFALFLFAENR